VIRLLLVDDHPVVREGLMALFGDDAEIEVVGAAGSGGETLDLARTQAPDVVLLDMELPDVGGLELIPQLLALEPRPGIIVFTAYDTDENVLGAVEAGAQGFLLKGASAAELALATRQVAAGGTYLEPRAAARLVEELRSPRPRQEALTPRELEVVRLVAGGMPNKQIARCLGIAERTVKYHISMVFAKLGAENRAGAVAIAGQRRLL
jgi:DNA-binding NarL/FixJ family response regulator